MPLTAPPPNKKQYFHLLNNPQTHEFRQSRTVAPSSLSIISCHSSGDSPLPTFPELPKIKAPKQKEGRCCDAARRPGQIAGAIKTRLQMCVFPWYRIKPMLKRERFVVRDIYQAVFTGLVVLGVWRCSCFLSSGHAAAGVTRTIETSNRERELLRRTPRRRRHRDGGGR